MFAQIQKTVDADLSKHFNPIWPLGSEKNFILSSSSYSERLKAASYTDCDELIRDMVFIYF